MQPGDEGAPTTARGVDDAAFTLSRLRPGYSIRDVDGLISELTRYANGVSE
jgi:hypothetical protein